MYIGYEIVEDLDTPNIMGMYLTLDLPSDLALDGAVIVQTVTYRKEFDYGSESTTVECKVVVGNADRTEVANYKGSVDGTNENGEEISYNAFAEDKLDHDEIDEGSEFYMIREDDKSSYETEEFGEYSGNKKQNCLVELEFPKTDFDYEWFGTYEVEFSARIYASEIANTFVEVEKTKTTQDFQPPIYSDSELVDAIEKIDNIYANEFMWESFTFDM